MKRNGKIFQYVSNERGKNQPLDAVWWVYEYYKVEDVSGEPIVVAPLPKPKRKRLSAQGKVLDARVMGSEDYNPGIARTYAPLRDHPDLFLRFARLAEKQYDKQGEKRFITVDDMLEWSGRYGLLGAEDIDHVALELASGVSLASSGEGRRESFSHFGRAVEEAARCLRLYEAVLAPNERGIEVLRSMYAQGEKRRPDALKQEALEEVERKVQARIESECYPLLYRRRGGGYVHGWGFRSLLGAMHLQMMWVMEAEDRITRCKFPDCFRIIDYEKPAARQIELNPKTKEPYKRGPYRTRKDKEFCSTNCKVKWHYHFEGGKEKARERRQSKQ